MSRGRVFDAFLFNDELDILELRLNALADVVDRFVLVESTVTFGGAEKPLHFAASRDRFARWLDRITHVVVSDTPDTGGNRWGRERFQRDRILRGLGECRCDDVVVVSDADEIPDPDAVAQRRLGGYHQEYMQYYLNCRHMSEYWVGSVAMYHFELAAEGPQRARDRRFELPRVERGGWHFAYAMTPDAFRAKLGAFSHAEYDTPEHAAAFEGRRAELTDVFAAKPGTLTVLDLDTAYLPEHLKTDRERYAHLLREGPLPTATAVAAAPPPPDTERSLGSPRTVVIYAYYETPRAAQNLELFAALGMAPEEGVRYVVVVNGRRCSVTLPEREDCTVLRRENLGFDFGAHAHALAHLAARHGVGAGELPFEHYVFINSSVTGPFLPPSFPRERHWTSVFTSRLDDRVKLVGPSIVCLPHSDAGGWGPRVEGYAFATDRAGLRVLLRQGGVFVDHPTKHAAVVAGEYGLSRAILAAGFTLDCLLYRYQGIDWTDQANWGLNANAHPTRAGAYDGISVHPFEVVFHKTHWSPDPSRSVAGEYVGKYRQWALEAVARRDSVRAPGSSGRARVTEEK